MKKILITNDDSISAPALEILKDRLSTLGKVVTVAPSTPMNAMGNSITLDKPVRINKLKDSVYSVTGTPADSARIGIITVMNEAVDLVVSGINDGANLGDDISYSGTVAAAREATLLGVPSMAVSLVRKDLGNFEQAADIALKFAEKILKKGLPPRIFLNLNVPDIKAEDLAGIKITKMGLRIYDKKVRERKDPIGKKYYWILGNILDGHKEEGTDFWAIANNYASLSPVTMDYTEHSLVNKLKTWISD